MVRLAAPETEDMAGDAYPPHVPAVIDSADGHIRVREQVELLQRRDTNNCYKQLQSRKNI